MASSARVRVVAPGGRTLAIAVVADTPVTRMVGLLRHRRLPAGEGMVLRPCSSVHTWFMRFAIDVLFVDRQLVVLRAVHDLRPFHAAWGGWKAALAIELPAGTLRDAGVSPGDLIRFEHT